MHGDRPARGRRWLRARGDAGAATLETTGMLALAALLAVAVATAGLASSPALGDTVRRAICLVTTLGQGSCSSPRTSAADHAPTQPCVVATGGHDASASVSFVVTLSTGEKWQVDQLSDGTYRVTRGTSGDIGAGVGAGFNVTGTWDDNHYGAALSASASAAATFSSGEVYYAADQDEVNDLLVAHAEDVAKDRLVGEGWPVRWLVDTAGDVTGLGHDLPDPDAMYVEGGISLDAAAQATLTTASADAKVGITETLGYRRQRDGSTTEYLKASISGGIQGSVLGGEEDGSGYQLAKAEAQGEVQGIIEIERDHDGTVTAVRLRSVLSGTLDANANTLESSAKDADGYVERTVELPVRSDTDRAVAGNFLSAMGLPYVPGLPSTVSAGLSAGPVALVMSTDAFAKAARDRGYITEQSYDNATSAYGGTFDAKAIAEVGGSVEVNTNGRTATGATYFDGTRMVTWPGCGG
jgi:hypothetical protein